MSTSETKALSVCRASECDPQTDAQKTNYVRAVGDLVEICNHLTDVTLYWCPTIQKVDFLYGEVTVDGVKKMLGSSYLNAEAATVLFDLGAGCGKLAIQAWLQYPNLNKVVGVELHAGRCHYSQKALHAMKTILSKNSNGREFQVESVQLDKDDDKKEVGSCQHSSSPLKKTTLIERSAQEQSRTLEFRYQNLLEAVDAKLADIIICETNIPELVYEELRTFLLDMKPGSRLLMYTSLKLIFANKGDPSTFFEQIAPNDAYYTTWAPKGGHMFNLYKRTTHRQD